MTAEVFDTCRVFAPEGGITVIATTTTAAAHDLSDADFLGSSIDAGKPYEIFASVAMWVKFSATGSTAIDRTVRSTAATGGGLGQGVPLAAGERLKFFFKTSRSAGLFKYLHVQNDVATAGYVVISEAGQPAA
jgi:hypothetical protein